nr:hypothetical protein [Tanacetum cinerariifolium]
MLLLPGLLRTHLPVPKTWIQDFMTRRVLLRCNGTGDLYLVTAPSPIPYAFLVSQHSWHQRLGHPRSDVLRRLVSNTIVSSCFDIVHSDVWTLPIPSLLGLSNDIYSLIDSNESAKDLWDALERQMCGSEYGEQDRKAAILYEYETFKAIEGEQLLDTYLHYLQVINDLKKCGYKKDSCDVNDALGYKKKAVVVTSDPLALVAEKTKVSKQKEKVVVSLDSEGSGADDFSELKKITALLAKAFNQRKFYSKPINNNLRTSSTSQSANKKQEFVKSDDEKKKDMSKTKMLLAKKDSNEQVLLAEDLAWMESSSDFDQEINANMVFMAQIKKVLSDLDKSSSSAEETIAEILFDKMSRQLVEMNNNTLRLQGKILEKETKILELEVCDSNKDAEIEKCLERLNEWIGFENPSYFEKAKDLRPSLYDEKVIGLGYTLMFLIHSDEALEIKKFKRARENKIEIGYDYGNLNAKNIIIDLEDEVVSLLEKEKANLKTIESLKSEGFESNENAISESENQSENDCQEVEKECDQMENPKVIAPGMFKLSVSQSVSPISVTKMSCDSKNVENLDTFSSIRRPKHSGVIWKKKGLSNTSNVDLSSVSQSILNKDVKQYSRKDLLSCNNSHLGETSSAYVCNDAMNVSCNSRFYDSFDENNLFIFDDESVRIYLVGKMPFRKKPRGSMNVHSKSNSNKSLPRTVHRWLPKMQPLVEPVAKWIPKVKRQIDKIYKTPNSSGPIFKWVPKHMTGNRALLTNFVEKFLGTVRFGNNDFVVITGYGDVVIGSMTIKKVYYVEGLGHNLFSVEKFCDKGLEVAFRKSTYFVRNEDGVDFLTGDRSLNLYTIVLNEVASNSSTCLLAKASSSQSWLWHQRLSHLNFAIINNLVKNNLVQGLPMMKLEKDHLCSACEQGKIHRKHHKSKTAFTSNKPLYILHMDLCGPIRVQNINGKRYVLVVVDDYSRYTWVFFLLLKDEASDVIIYFKP